MRLRKKLDIACTATDCNSGLHCFKATDKMVAESKVGVCRACGAKLVDWKRVHSRDLMDAQNTFKMLKLEKVRHFFWHIDLTQHAVNHARRKGRKALKERVRKHLSKAIAPQHPWHDGFQTAMQQDAPSAIPYGQHATATCCRKCLEYWHGIPQGKALSEKELDYFTELVCLYIQDRIPTLKDEGEIIPPIRSKKEPS